MAKKKKKNRALTEETEESAGRLGLAKDTIYAVLSIVFFAIALFFILASFGVVGIVGTHLHNGLSKLLGLGYYLLPALFFLLGISYFKSQKTNLAITNVLGSLMFCLSGLGLIEIMGDGMGGLIGGWLAHPLSALFDTAGSVVFLIALFFISLLILANAHPVASFRAWKERKEVERLACEAEEEDLELAESEEDDVVVNLPQHNSEEVAGAEALESAEKKGFFGKKKRDDESVPAFAPFLASLSTYTPPPLSIFARDSGTPGVGDIKANANIIKRTLQNFGIDVAMDEVSIGPSVTRYAMKPAEGVRLSKILGLQKNLELALAAHPVRIEAPIPGKALVGVEVPNSAKTTVGLSTLLTSPDYAGSDKPLMVALGRDVDGNATFTNLAKMPHMLIAGATGSGKSVTIHALINSLLFRNGPDALRFVMVDPKRVELTLYNGIPHLLTPVITDPKKTILSLKWLVHEMERRYTVLEEKRVRDISSYHSTILSPALEKLKNKGADEEIETPETMPYIVLIIDELADIMSTYPRELEAGIVRLAQMSRAVGIHLILSTQRPSVNIITGLIKANIPGRVALQVSSQIDSRTILDTSGAEKLLGAGDMLFTAGDMSKPKRIQSAFITEKEVKKVTDFLRNHGNDDAFFDVAMDLDAMKGGSSSSTNFGGDDDDIDDDLFEEARETVIHAGKASTSYLQRKLRVGYARAARLMDILEERGIIGPADGAKPRDILVEHGGATEGEDIA
ncbi:MAG: DNA translocase FtsK [Patescibacteria group bacterium]